MNFFPLVFAVLLPVAALSARDSLTATVKPPLVGASERFQMGTATRPDGATLSLDSRSLRLNEEPWVPVMGEFHYSRYPAAEWREELLKMKAGGISIVATYVFWIHHEEVEGEWNWSGQRDLRRFVETAHDAGLHVVVRCGPWCHGEVRNGGLPDWLLASGLKVRSDDPGYLEKTRLLYRQIGAQLRGLLWKDGGPVIGVQLENEYSGDGAHLLTLKGLAREAGLDVPLYTRTGWPALRTPLPFGEIVPLFGAYAEGFWDRVLAPMPGNYWTAFRFSRVRTDAAIATDQLGERAARDEADAARYPYFTCELGGGMMPSYHRRIRIDPADIESVMLAKLGSGGNLPGYYMYHGGTNPDGRTPLMEAQSTAMTNWNDLPVKTYDFQAPLGEFGQVRPHYHLLRRVHLFLGDFGPALAGMPATLPDQLPGGRDDTTTLRWSVRSDGTAGFVFVSNYERLMAMPPKTGVQFTLRLGDGTLTFPAEPITIPSDARFFWPFHFNLGHGERLTYATAQPLCAIDDGDTRTVFFAETPGVPATFAFADGTRVLRPSLAPGLRRRAADGQFVQIVLLDEATSLRLWKGRWQGRDRVFLTHADLVLEEDRLRLTSSDRSTFGLTVYPAPAAVSQGDARLEGRPDGLFTKFTPVAPPAIAATATAELIRPAGPAREIPLGKIKSPVAAAPEDADFESAAVWRIRFPKGLDLAADPVVRIDYAGDVARARYGGRLLTDDFYHGRPFELGLKRHPGVVAAGEFQFAVLPLRADAPIHFTPGARPDFAGAATVCALGHVEIVPRYTIELR